jgi:hypothetical protein
MTPDYSLRTAVAAVAGRAYRNSAREAFKSLLAA